MISEEKIIEWFHAYGKEIFLYLIHILGNHADAEDILHDCFANLIEYAQKYELRENTIKSFLYRSAHNNAINHLKMKSTQEIAYNEIPKSNCIGQLPQENIEKEELEIAINAALLKLDPLTRSIFIMKKELSMTNDEIAQNLSISEKTVRRKLEKAINFIIKDLKKHGFEIF